MQRPRILVVDDNRDVAEMFIRFFELRRYRLAWAHCGVTGLALAKVTKPDLVLLNLQMPRMNGLEVLRELRADPATKDMKVIMTSAHDLISKWAPEAGAQDFVVYPANFEEVGVKVERVLAGNGG